MPKDGFANRTVFEFFAPPYELPVASGGRYDYLAEALGGRITPSVGGAIGLERVIEAMKRQEIAPHAKSKPKVFFVVIGDQAKKSALKLMNQLRSSGVAVVEVVGKKTLKAQLKIAERMSITLALLLGQKEVFDGTVIVRDMVSGVQETVLTEKLVEEVKKRLH
jgi:histidyl-tRNA synthetase